MTGKVCLLKPFHLEDKREGPAKTVSETTVIKWEGCILANGTNSSTRKPGLSSVWHNYMLTFLFSPEDYLGQLVLQGYGLVLLGG